MPERSSRFTQTLKREGTPGTCQRMMGVFGAASSILLRGMLRKPAAVTHEGGRNGTLESIELMVHEIVF